MKTKHILFLVIGILFIATFFFKIIPVPVENMEGARTPDKLNFECGNNLKNFPVGTECSKFEYGGIYWTSILYEIGVRI